jgi:membrane-associated protease RseP (regulator of RpoE activity)
MPIILFIIVFALTIVLQQWLHRHIQGFILLLTGDTGCALRLLFYLLMPGVLLHEMSHYVVARLLLVKTGSFRVGIGNTRKRLVSLGSVNIQRADPIRESLIGVAPFVVGVAAIWLLTGLGFDLWPSSGLSIAEFFQRVQTYSNDWTTWLDIYLIFSVSTAMIPSESDREPWGPVITFFGLGTAILFLLGWTPRMPIEAMTTARNLLDALTFALGIAVVVNGVTAMGLWILEQTVLQLSGRRVEYRVKSDRQMKNKKPRG